MFERVTEELTREDCPVCKAGLDMHAWEKNGVVLCTSCGTIVCKYPFESHLKARIVNITCPHCTKSTEYALPTPDKHDPPSVRDLQVPGYCPHCGSAGYMRGMIRGKTAKSESSILERSGNELHKHENKKLRMFDRC